VGFSNSSDLYTDYLIDEAKLVLLKKDRNSNFIDIMLHLPYADDFLLRIPQNSLESNSSIEQLLKESKILRISNPFFGIKTDIPLAPIFFNNTYLRAGNYFPSTSVIYGYYINRAVRDKAIEFGTGLINLLSLETKNEPKVYTFAVVEFKEFIDSIHESPTPRTYDRQRLQSPSDGKRE
jgi:hypothetical protein